MNPTPPLSRHKMSQPIPKETPPVAPRRPKPNPPVPRAKPQPPQPPAKAKPQPPAKPPAAKPPSNSKRKSKPKTQAKPKEQGEERARSRWISPLLHLERLSPPSSTYGQLLPCGRSGRFQARR